VKPVFISLLTVALLSASRPLSAAAEPAAAPMAQTQGVQCLSQETPPPPPDGGAVIAGPYDPNSNEPNVIVVPGWSDSSGGWNAGQCGPNAQAIMRQPTSIAVASPANGNEFDGAVIFQDYAHGLSSPWGAVNASSTSPLVLYPGRPDFAPNVVQVWWGKSANDAPPGINDHPSLAEFVADHQSCRECELTGVELVLMVNPLDSANSALGGRFAYGGNFSGADMRGTTITPRDMTGLPVTTASLIGWDFSNADLSEVSGLESANLSGANLSGANLTNTNLQGANLSGTNLSGANLTNTNLQGANLSGTNLSGVTGLQGANLSGLTLTSANLSGTSLQGATLTSTQLDHVIANGTVFDGAYLSGAMFDTLQFEVAPSFNGVNVGPDPNGACTVIQKTDLRNANLTLITIAAGCQTSPLLPGSTVPLGPWIAFLRGASELGSVDLSNAQFAVDNTSSSRLAGLDLSGINLNGMAFVGVPLDLSGTTLDGASMQGTTLALANLSGASLQNVNAPGASFRGAMLAASGNGKAATFAGSSTNLEGADFVQADISGASFSSADLTNAVFSYVLANGTDFTGVKAPGASFTGAHIYGNGEAFNNASDLTNVDFSGAVLAGDTTQSGGFNLTSTNLTNAHFDNAQCIGCNFTGSSLQQTTFSGAYVLGAILSNAHLQGANLVNAWFYCGDTSDSACPASGSSKVWRLDLGFPEVYGPVPFVSTNMTSIPREQPRICPDGTSGTSVAAVCVGHWLPSSIITIPAACSASAADTCPTKTTTLFDGSQLGPSNQPVKALSVVPMVPPTWSTALADNPGYAVGMNDATVRHASGGAGQILAGSAGKPCPSPTQACGDGGVATEALLGTPAGLAVGIDGSLYIADPSLHRVRRIDPSGNINTVAGNGQACANPGACGDGGAATAAQLSGPYGVWVGTLGQVVIADGPGGLRQIHTDGSLSTVGGTNTYDVRAVTGDSAGNLYAATRDPDYIIQADLNTALVNVVVGTGTSGYNSNTDSFSGLLLPGPQVQVNAPGGVSVDLNGNVLFADTGNSLIRAYVPSSGKVIDDLGGVANTNTDTTQSGFNGDGQWANLTLLNSPGAVTATSGALLVVADTDNARLRQLGPAPLDESARTRLTSPAATPTSRPVQSAATPAARPTQSAATPAAKPTQAAATPGSRPIAPTATPQPRAQQSARPSGN
jgi:uncharacterized protein YjbI with pentapeptide repeats